MGTDAITMDFNGVITPNQLKEIEYRANQVVVKNVAILDCYPSKEELLGMEYRSKIEIEGQVRIIEIPGVDRCACCAPHVSKTGEIGLVKLLNVQNYKGGVRVSMLCGFRALLDYNEKAESVRKLSMMLSAKEKEVVDEVARLQEELNDKKQTIARLQKEAIVQKVESLSKVEACMVVFEEELDGNGPRELMNLLLEKGAQVAAVFTGTQTAGFRYVIGSKVVDVRLFAKNLNAAFDGRGGGKPEMVQGSLHGNCEAIREEVLKCSQNV